MAAESFEFQSGEGREAGVGEGKDPPRGLWDPEPSTQATLLIVPAVGWGGEGPYRL